MIAPHTGNFIDKRLGDMTIGEHHGERKIGAHKTVGERAKSDENQPKLRARAHIRDTHETGRDRICARQPGAHLHQTHTKRANQREMANSAII